MSHKRGANGTVQRRVFLALLVCSGSAEEIARAGIALTAAMVHRSTRSLMRRGILGVRNPGTKRAMYFMLPGAVEPTDQRGKPDGCRNRRKKHEDAKERDLIARRERAKRPDQREKKNARERAKRKRAREQRETWLVALGKKQPPPIPAERVRVHSMGD